MLDREESRALEEARLLVETFGSDAPLYAAIKAKAAMEERDLARCARWKRVFEILDEDSETCGDKQA